MPLRRPTRRPRPRSATPEPTETTPAVTKDASYSSAEDLYDTATTVVDGLGGWTPDDESSANSISSGQDADENVTFSVYDDRATLLSDANAATLGDADQVDSVLVGQNWMLVGATETLDLLQPKLGGEHPTWADKTA